MIGSVYARQSLSWVAGVALLVGVPWAFKWYGWSFTDGIYFATGVILLWYTIETQATRQAIVRQNEIAVRPFLVAAVEPWSMAPAAPIQHFEDRLVVRNIGFGPALFVRIQTLRLERTEVSFE